MSRTLRSLAFALPLLGVASLPVRAQEPATEPRAALRGAVQDTSGAPLELAEVEIVGLDRRAVTTATGGYRLADIPPGKYWVTVRRIGYVPFRVALTLASGSTRQIVFQLDRQPQHLADLEVTATDQLWETRFRDFVNRARFHTGWGVFLTRDDIAEARAVRLGDVVRRYFPWISSQALDHALFLNSSFWDPWSPRETRSYSASAVNRYACPPAVSLNGGQPHGAWAVNDFAPQEVEALEVYRRISEVPLEFVSPGQGGPSCGLVVIWLR